MITLTSILLLTLAIFYTIILIKIIRGLFKLKKGNESRLPNVSVVVAARDEEQNITACLNGLIVQKYPPEKYEIIVVNDRSQDRTAEIVQDFTETDSRIRLINISETNSTIASKMWALDLGIRQARGEIILTTDADCVVQPDWASLMVSYFKDDVGFVAGYSPLDLGVTSSLFHQFVALEALTLAGVMGGSFGARFPLTCSGRNLAYRKSVYYQVGGFNSIGVFIGGDDDLFLHLIQDRTDWKFRFAIDGKSTTSSKPASTFKQFYNQKIRHASKGLYYKSSIKMGLIALYLFNLLLLVLLFFQKIWPLLIFVFCIKSLLEFILIFKTAKIFRQKKVLKYFPLTILLQPLYIVIFGLWGQIGKFDWKHQTFTSKLESN